MRRHAIRRLVCGLLPLAWFLYFSRDVLGVHFAPDDMMNVDNFYWTPGLWRLFYSQFLIWRGYYRPMGGLFYLPILSVWGLNPAPYHVALSLVLAVNVYLVYRLARLLGAGEWAAGLAALVACYHAGLGNLYYNTAFVYDALCGCFFLAALVYYCGIRDTGRLLSVGQKAIFAALVLCALNSKEMALTLPAILAVYEWIYHPSASYGPGPVAKPEASPEVKPEVGSQEPEAGIENAPMDAPFARTSGTVLSSRYAAPKREFWSRCGDRFIRFNRQVAILTSGSWPPRFGRTCFSLSRRAELARGLSQVVQSGATGGAGLYNL